MDYNSLIKTEDTDVCFNDWEEYRNNLTDYVMDSIESYYTREYLKRTGKKRLVREYGMKEIVEELGEKPSLAIWGAGGCNDIDICRLAKYFKLILIDHNLEKIVYAKKRFNLSDDECICVDLKFWDISNDDYLMMEAMIKDEVTGEELGNYIEDMIAKMPGYDYSTMPHFDFSVAVGLVSQLNSRLAALIHINKYQYDMTKYLYDMNFDAVDKFLNAIVGITNKMFVLGYEDRILETEGKVAGNDILENRITSMIESENIKNFMDKELVWNFISEKSYIMQINSYELI